MAEPEIEILDIIIDCADPASLASFWGELLGLPIAGREGPYVWLQRSAHAPGMGFQKVSHPKTEASSSWPIPRATSSAWCRPRRSTSTSNDAPTISTPFQTTHPHPTVT